MSKKHLTLALFSIVISVISISCQKGDTGPAGPQGQQGQPGVVGPAGADGATFYSGTGAPAATTGKPGDFYIDLTADVLYGPKTSSGWGGGFSMKGNIGATGQTGPAGTPGTKVYAGTGTPGSAIGVIGDFYVDTVAHNLYGPKLAAGWGIPVALQGATGPAGPQGPQGPAGTANVQYTPWFSPTPDWIGANPIYYDQSVPALTPDILSKGTVLVFCALDGYATSVVPANSVTQMPVTLNYKVVSGFIPVSVIDVWDAFASTTNIHIQFSTTGNGYLPGLFPYTKSQFRLIIIPGGVYVPANISYKELKTYLHVNIPD